jgi:hypothetical protein
VGVAALLRATSGITLVLGCTALACSAEEVQPASAMPGEMREGARVETQMGALDPAPSLPGEMPASAREPGVRPPGGLPLAAELPDLVLDRAYLLDTTRFEAQRIDDPCAVQHGCATGLGERQVVRFGSRMGNLGNADFVLGAPSEGNPPWSLDSCGGGFSLPGFARYQLRDAEGRQVLQGSKSQFCITDAEEWIPDSGANCQTFSCGRQGIAPGCADNYGIDLPCQWLDITDVAPGDYELQITVNAARSVAELDYANNTATLLLRVSEAGGAVLGLMD